MLLCAGCVLIVCVAVIGWCVRVVWVSRHEQSVSLCRAGLRWCVAVGAAVHAGVVRDGRPVAWRSGLARERLESVSRCMKTIPLLGC